MHTAEDIAIKTHSFKKERKMQFDPMELDVCISKSKNEQAKRNPSLTTQRSFPKVTSC